MLWLRRIVTDSRCTPAANSWPTAERAAADETPVRAIVGDDPVDGVAPGTVFVATCVGDAARTKEEQRDERQNHELCRAEAHHPRPRCEAAWSVASVRAERTADLMTPTLLRIERAPNL